MKNEVKQQYLNLDKNILKTFFKEFIEDTKNCTENKTQTILSLLSSIKEETEKKISKSKIFFNNFIFLHSHFFLRKTQYKFRSKSQFKFGQFFNKKYDKE